MNKLLVNIDDIRKYNELSKHVDIDDKIKPAIFRAQEFDVRPALGDNLFLAILEEIDNDFGIYKELMEGSVYEYSGRSYQHDGLVAVIAFYAYARIIPALDENVSAYGMIQKTNEYATPNTDKRISAKVAEAVSCAEVMKNRVIDFLNRNNKDYPLFVGNMVAPKTGGIRISAVGGKNKIGGSHRCGSCGRYSCNCNRYYK